MKKILPKTNLGKWSIFLIVLMPILFAIGGSFTNTLYESVSSGDTILEDIVKRPVLSLTMLSGMLSVILAFAFGIISIIRKKERSPLVYISTILGFLLILFLIAEIVFPH